MVRLSSTRFNLAKAALCAALALTLAACGPGERDPEAEGGEDSRARPDAPTAGPDLGRQDDEATVVTSVFAPGGAVGDLVFIPNADEPWRGLLAANLAQGGFDIYNIDGQRVITASGPALEGLAAATDFQLRGEAIPLLFGVDAAGALRAFALLREAEAVAELAIEPVEAPGGFNALCLFEEGIGYVDLALSSQDGPGIEIWRVSDQGGEGLNAERRVRVPGAFRFEACASDGAELVISGFHLDNLDDANTPRLLRITLEGEVLAERVSETGLAALGLAYAELRGLGIVLVIEPGRREIVSFGFRTLEPFEAFTVGEGLNAPAIQRPAALAATTAPYGGVAFSVGLIAVYDASDSRIKLLAGDRLRDAVLGEE